MGQSCSSMLCIGETDEVVNSSYRQQQDPHLLNQSHQQRAGSHFGRKKGQRKRGSANATSAADCAEPKMFNLMAQSILQQQILYDQQQKQPPPIEGSSAKSQASAPSATSLGGQNHLLYRKHPKSILAFTGASSSSAHPSQSVSSLLTANSVPPWGPQPRRNIPTKLIVRRPRRGTFPLSYQDEGLSGTQIYAIRYWLKNAGKDSNDDHYEAIGVVVGDRATRVSHSDDEVEFQFIEKDDDQDFVWMMMQDDEEDEDEETTQQRRRQRQQEQYPGMRKNMGSNLLPSSVLDSSMDLPTLKPLYYTKCGNVGYSTSVPSSAFRDLERMRQPSAAAAVNDGDLADVLVTAGNFDSSDSGKSMASIGPAQTSATTTRDPSSTSSWTASGASTTHDAMTPPAAWSTPSANSVTNAVPTGDFFTPQALAMRQHRPVLEWITISEEYNIHVADVGLTAAECDNLVQITEQVCRGQYAAYTYAKQTLGCREYPVLAQACLEPVHSVVEAIRTYTTIHPHNSSAYFGCTNLQLDDREPHMVKYDVTKKERQKLDMHTDKSEWTFLIALSNGCGLDYDGGGTFFECLDATVHVQRGHALIFPGKLRHCGQRITTGLRFILVGFLVDKPMLPLSGATTSNLLAAASARCSGPMAIPPDHHRA